MPYTYRRIRDLALLAGIGFLASAAARSLAQRASGRRAALSERAEREMGRGTVRPSGAEAMRDPPERWSREDELVDETFPASDPPGTY